MTPDDIAHYDPLTEEEVAAWLDHPSGIIFLTIEEACTLLRRFAADWHRAKDLREVAEWIMGDIRFKAPEQFSTRVHDYCDALEDAIAAFDQNEMDDDKEKGGGEGE